MKLLSFDRNKSLFRPLISDRDPVLLSALICAALGLFIRIAFWVYTNRVWEDAYITVTPAKNFWLGNGLTHHISEPRVHSFTSPLSVLIPTVGEALIDGILSLRIASLLAYIATAWTAYRLARVFVLRAAPSAFFFLFLALDQLHIFFGMSGMETQVVTALLLFSVLKFLESDYLFLGLSLGLCIYARPEFGLWILVVIIFLLVARREYVTRVSLLALIVALPWLIGTTVYYGSPVPQTIVAKGLYPSSGLRFYDLDKYLSYLGGIWERVSPFFTYSFTLDAPIPRGLLQTIVAGSAVLVIFGAVRVTKRSSHYGIPFVAVILFGLYLIAAQVPDYFMWYLPPFTALWALYLSVGLSELAATAWRTGVVSCCAISAVFSMHLPATFLHEREVQQKIEDGVRTEVGVFLDSVMTVDDSVVLEPLGYIGFHALNKTTFDYPGLSSPTVTNLMKDLPANERNIFELINQLEPTFIVLRSHEVDAFRELYPLVFTRFSEVARFTPPSELDFTHWGVRYFTVDASFVVLRQTN